MYVYRITNAINGKMYIGMHNGNKTDYMGSGILLKQAYEKYGIENFTKEILQVCNSIEELQEAEIRWIESENAVADEKYYNLAAGGIGGDTGFRETTNMSEVVKKQWAKYTHEEKMERMRKHNSSFDRSGSKNSKAKMAIVNGKLYDCLKDATKDYPNVPYSSLKEIAQKGQYSKKHGIEARYVIV